MRTGVASRWPAGGSMKGTSLWIIRVRVQNSVIIAPHRSRSADRGGRGWPTGGSMKRISHRIIRIRVQNSDLFFYYSAAS